MRDTRHDFAGALAVARQLAQVAAVTWSRYRRRYSEIMTEFLDSAVVEHDEEDRRFDEQLQLLTVTGRSPGGWIELHSRALVHWQVTIAQGTLVALSEESFLTELRAALAELLADYRMQQLRLTDEIYGLGLPPKDWQPEDADQTRNGVI
jgi:hypothetical protein